MTKTKIACRVHEIVDESLFGNKAWPVNKTATWLELGLREDIGGHRFRNTPLGNELNIDLMNAFIWDPAPLLEFLDPEFFVRVFGGDGSD